MIPDVLASPRLHLAPPWLHLAPNFIQKLYSKMASTTRDSTTPIESEFNYFYEPDIYNPPGSCINEFKDVGELIDYIDVQTQDCYAEIKVFEDSHTGKDGQLLDMVNMSIRNVYNEEVNLNIFDRHMSRTEIKYEIRQQLEEITAIFEQNKP